ncbi:MAG TPA: hypothetical protein VLX92_21930 [Kofleriaceae bacterium]|nr:hypothetical protein [Kofleriaceae bacterium]
MHHAIGNARRAAGRRTFSSSIVARERPPRRRGVTIGPGEPASDRVAAADPGVPRDFD